ncbi:MAG: energy transducer TonB [Bacteroidales bacterium]|jgi:hypothetical protein|nr:energy transducer TonB [Bacteroidales bacterium]
MKYTDDNSNDKKRKIIAILTTGVFHVLLLYCFLFMGLTYQVPPPPEYGIEVDMGGGGGGSERQTTNRVSDPTPSSSAPKEDLSTQDIEESTTLNATRKPVAKPTSSNPTPTEDKNVNATPVVNPDALFRRNAAQGGGGSGSGSGSGVGSGTETGTGSKPGDGKGNGGGDFFLDGRPVIHKERPAAKNNLEGIVKVYFLADKEGTVVYAKVNVLGTTIMDLQIWAECERAAMRSKFKAKADAQLEEKGVITYKFVTQ